MNKPKLLALLLLALLLAGCSRDERVTARLTDYGAEPDFTEAQAFPPSDRVSGYWGDPFIRSNGQTYPFDFDAPLYQCRGFTLEYEIISITEGSCEGNFMYEAYVRTTADEWRSVALFRMDGLSTTVEVSFDYPMDIEAVAVVCGKRERFLFTHDIRILNPI